MNKEKIQELSKNIFDEVVGNRRHLHSHPELSFHEVETSAYVAKKLEEMGLQYHKMADTGLVALIKGDKPSDQVGCPACGYGRPADTGSQRCSLQIAK